MMSRQPEFSAQGYSTQQQPRSKPAVRNNVRSSQSSPKAAAQMGNVLSETAQQRGQQPLPRFDEQRRQQTSQNAPNPTALNPQSRQVSGSGLQTYQTQLELAQQTIAQNGIESDENAFQPNQYLLSESDLKRPPVSIFQEDIYNLPSKQQKEAHVLFDTLGFIHEQVPGAERLRGPRDLVYFSRKAVEIQTRNDLRERRKGHRSINSELSSCLLAGVRTVAFSPDCSQFALLKPNFDLLIYDRKRGQLSEIKGLNKQTFVCNDIDVDPFQHDLDFETSEAYFKDQFQLFVNNDGSIAVVFCKITNHVYVWERQIASETDLLPSFKKEVEAPKAEPKAQLRQARPLSATKEKPEEQRSQSRLRQFFNLDLLRLGSNRSSSQSKLSTPKKTNKVHAEQTPQSSEPQKSSLIQTKGIWFSITKNLGMEADFQIGNICQTQCVRFVPSTQSPTPQLIGFSGKACKISLPRDDIIFTKVELANAADYFAFFEQAEVTGPDSKRSEGASNEDTPNKLLVITQNKFNLGGHIRGDIIYDENTTKSIKTTKLAQIEHLGLLPEPGTCNSELNLICRPDNQNSLLAIVTNSQHIFYCQLIFCSIDKDFATCMKLFNFQQQYESPPLDKRGKANLQVDDIQWTLNDAFVLIMFSTGALAVLPRLGSQLLQVFNPTLANVQRKDTQLFEQYKHPRMFNQLIQSAEVQQHVKKLKGDVKQRFRLSMHPFDLAFTVYDGQVAFVMRMELEPELTELFDRQNMSFYFMRFCLSMRKLASDPEILEKVPKLLTSKLPLFEMEKESEKLDEQSPELRVMTAAQINPFQMEDKRMETVQSFDADFEAEPQVVLLNLKNLLVSFRWSKDLTVNYLQWLITVVNDCVYYFLKHSEPVYAFHALALAEFYLKKVYLPPTKDQSLPTIESKPTKEKKTRKSESAKAKEELASFASRMCDPIQEIYAHQSGHPIAKCNPDLNPKSLLKVHQKVELVSDFLKDLPTDNALGSASNFSFERNYCLLVLYSLIQFRNYQASNFNIINLQFACYIVQKFLCKRMTTSLQQIKSLVEHNHLILDKTDEIELFFGKVGTNKIQSSESLAKVYYYWMHKVMKHSNCFHSRFFEENNLLLLTKLGYDQTIATSDLSVAQGKSVADHAAEQTSKYNIKYMKDIMPVVRVALALQRGDIESCVNEVRQIAETYEHGKVNARIPMQVYGVSLSLLTQYLTTNIADRTSSYVPRLKDVLHAIARSAVNLDKKSPINCISSHYKIFQVAFTKGKRQAGFMSKAMLALKTTSQVKLLKTLAVICFCHGNLEQACQLLSRSCGPSSGATLPCDLLFFQIHLLSSALKQETDVYASNKERLNGFDINKVTDLQTLMSTTERLNVIQTIKFGYRLLNQAFTDVVKLMGNSGVLGSVLWTCGSLMHPGLSNILKEELAIKAVKAMRHVIKIRQQKLHSYRGKKVRKGFSILDKFPVAKHFLLSAVPNFASTIDFALSEQEELQMRFLQQLEVLLVCIHEQGDQSERCTLNQAAPAVLPKLTKIVHYLRIMSNVKSLDTQVNTLSAQLADVDAQSKSELKHKIDESLVQSLKQFLALINIESLVQAQQYIKRNLHVLIYLLTHPDSTALDQPNPELYSALRRLAYNRLNAENKRIVKELYEQIKTQSPECGGLAKVIGLLQSQIEGEKMTIGEMLEDFSREEKTKLLASMSEQKRSETGMDSLQRELWRITQEETRQELDKILKAMNIEILFEEAHKRANMVKATFLATYAHARSIVGLPIKTSFFYRGSCFEQREGNIFGVTEEDLEPFEEDADSSLEEILQKTCLKIDQTVVQIDRETFERDQDIRTFIEDQKDVRWEAEQQSHDDTAFRQQFILSHKIKADGPLPTTSKSEAELAAKSFDDDGHDENSCRSGQVTQRFFQMLPQKQPTTTPVILNLKKVSKLSKVTLRKNSTRRQVAIKPLNESPKRLPRPKGMHLPPKPTLKVPLATEKLTALTKLSVIATKDLKAAFNRWKVILPKFKQDQRFNLMVLQPGKLKLYTVKDPRKLYKDTRIGNTEVSPAKDRKAFDLMSVKQLQPKDAVQEAEQKILGKKVQVVNKLEKTPIQLPPHSKLTLLRNIMRRMEDVGAQLHKLENDFENQQKQEKPPQ